MCTTPKLFVQVNRDIAASWWHRPWAEIKAAAEQGEPGLVVITQQPKLWQGVGTAAPDPPNVAYLAAADPPHQDIAILFQQNW